MSMNEGITYVGLDAHKDHINVAVMAAGSVEVSSQWQLAHELRSLKRLAKKLVDSVSGPVVAAYEAGPCGFALKRRLDELGVDCRVVAPSMIPVRPGDRVKTDRRDARKLATLLQAGLLTEVRAPTLEEEALRDLTRAREDANHDLMRARHRLSKMLLRYGFVFSQGKNWTQKHMAWLRSIRFEQPCTQRVFNDYLLAIEQIKERLDELTDYIEDVAAREPYQERVGWLRCLRGVDTITAITVLAELHDFRRFAHPRDLMAYLGLTPSEHSSSTHVRRGGITKTGNGHVRRVLIEAAWNYRHRPAVSAYLRTRRKGQPPCVIAIADRAQRRLHKRYYKLKEGYRKPHNVVAVAIARELVGFIWAVLNHQQAA